MADSMRAVRRGNALRSFAGCCAAAMVMALAACATPAERFEQRAIDLGFTPSSLRGEGFRHRAYLAGPQAGADTIHVYIEHDGTPWLGTSHVSEDTTPRIPFALELMARDVGPRLFLGRPCHFEPKDDPACGPLVWTHRRYSPEVVASMVKALRDFMALHHYRRAVLVGYSGGGTLAWLMARQVPETVGVVTVAANLDIDRWTGIHGYTPLAGSLNPALLPALPPAIPQLHYAGGRDRNVPPAVVESFHRGHPEARVVIIADFDHACCWAERWPELLGRASGHPPAAGRQPD